MSYPDWQANTAFLVGDVVRASASQNLTLAFKCIVAGTSDDTEPVFPRQITHTVVDDEVTWEAFEPLSDELQKLAPTAVIDLFEIHLTSAVNGSDSVLYYHAGTNGLVENIVFDNKIYPAAPVEVDGFSFSAKGTLPRPTLKVANVNNAISALLITVNPLKAEVDGFVRSRNFLI